MAPLTLFELFGLGSVLFHEHFTDYCWYVGVPRRTCGGQRTTLTSLYYEPPSWVGRELGPGQGRQALPYSGPIFFLCSRRGSEGRSRGPFCCVCGNG